MDAQDGNAAAALSDLAAAIDRAPRVDFFTLLDLVERVRGGVSLGTSASPAEEPVRLAHDASLAFASRDVRHAETAADHRLRITTSFFGLSGAAGALPLSMREEIAQEGDDEPVRRDLVDLFHHRALSLLHRSVMRARPAATMRSDGRDAWSERLLGLGGATASALGAGDRLRILPLLATRRRSARGLEAALQILLRARVGTTLAVRVEELVGARTPMAPPQRVRLGSANHALGRETALGGSVADPAGRVRVQVGPVSADVLPRFHVGGDLHALAREVFVLFDAGATDLELEVEADRAHGTRLGARQPLGRTTWIGGRARAPRVRIAA